MNIYEELDGLLLTVLPEVYRSVRVVPSGSKRPLQFVVWRELPVENIMSSDAVYAVRYTFSVSIFSKAAPEEIAEQITNLLIKNRYIQSGQKDLDYEETTGYYGKYLEFYKVKEN